MSRFLAELFRQDSRLILLLKSRFKEIADGLGPLVKLAWICLNSFTLTITHGPGDLLEISRAAKSSGGRDRNFRSHRVRGSGPIPSIGSGISQDTWKAS